MNRTPSSFQDVADVGERGLQAVIADMVQHAVHHDDVGAGEFAGGGGIEMAAMKRAEMAERPPRIGDIGLVDVEAGIIDAIRQMAQDMAGPASDIDHPHSRPQRQVIRDRLDAGAKEATGILIGLVERGMAQDRLHQEASS